MDHSYSDWEVYCLCTDQIPSIASTLPVNTRAQNMFSRDVKRLSFRCQTLKFSRPNVKFLRYSRCSRGSLCSLDCSLSARSRNQRKISEKLFTDMESRKSIEDFLREVDEDILIYAGELRSNGFMSTASTKYLTENDLAGIPEGHKRLILNMVSCLRMPVHERPQTKFPSFSEEAKTVLSVGDTSVGQEVQWS